METHTFTPGRPDGTVCVADRSDPDDTRGANLCGFPAGHPIHATVLVKSLEAQYGPGVLNTPAETRTGISDRNAAALADVAELRSALVTFDAGGLRDDDALFEALERIEQALRGGGA